jgi:hypothetical protein
VTAIRRARRPTATASMGVRMDCDCIDAMVQCRRRRKALRMSIAALSLATLTGCASMAWSVAERLVDAMACHNESPGGPGEKECEERCRNRLAVRCPGVLGRPYCCGRILLSVKTISENPPSNFAHASGLSLKNSHRGITASFPLQDRASAIPPGV